MAELTCGCCDRPADRCDLCNTKGCPELYGLPQVMCHDCLCAWYGGMTDPDAIKARVLAEEAERA